MDSAPGQRALTALDRALAHQPERDGDAFSEATEQLCQFRDAMIGDARAGERRDDLGALNAIISGVLAGHFPLGKTPWPEVQSATDALRRLLQAG